jgi:hypothetical protein
LCGGPGTPARHAAVHQKECGLIGCGKKHCVNLDYVTECK